MLVSLICFLFGWILLPLPIISQSTIFYEFADRGFNLQFPWDVYASTDFANINEFQMFLAELNQAPSQFPPQPRYFSNGGRIFGAGGGIEGFEGTLLRSPDKENNGEFTVEVFGSANKPFRKLATLYSQQYPFPDQPSWRLLQPVVILADTLMPGATVMTLETKDNDGNKVLYFRRSFDEGNAAPNIPTQNVPNGYKIKLYRVKTKFDIIYNYYSLTLPDGTIVNNVRTIIRDDLENGFHGPIDRKSFKKNTECMDSSDSSSAEDSNSAGEVFIFEFEEKDLIMIGLIAVNLMLMVTFIMYCCHQRQKSRYQYGKIATVYTSDEDDKVINNI